MHFFVSQPEYISYPYVLMNLSLCMFINFLHIKNDSIRFFIINRQSSTNDFHFLRSEKSESIVKKYSPVFHTITTVFYYWNNSLQHRTSAWVFSCKFAAYFQNPFS